jgi:hypothetical protein
LKYEPIEILKINLGQQSIFSTEKKIFLSSCKKPKVRRPRIFSLISLHLVFVVSFFFCYLTTLNSSQSLLSQRVTWIDSKMSVDRATSTIAAAAAAAATVDSTNNAPIARLMPSHAYLERASRCPGFERKRGTPMFTGYDLHDHTISVFGRRFSGGQCNTTNETLHFIATGLYEDWKRHVDQGRASGPYETPRWLTMVNDISNAYNMQVVYRCIDDPFHPNSFSRYHFVLLPPTLTSSSSFCIIDIDSSNGIYIEGVRCLAQSSGLRHLISGDRLRFSSPGIPYESIDSNAASSTAAPASNNRRTIDNSLELVFLQYSIPSAVASAAAAATTTPAIDLTHEEPPTRLAIRRKADNDDDVNRIKRNVRQCVNPAASTAAAADTSSVAAASTAATSVTNNIVQTAHSEFECTICSNLIYQLVGLPCSHTFCCVCIEEWRDTKLRAGIAPACPVCRAAFDATRPFTIMRSFDRLIEQMEAAMTEDQRKERHERLASIRDRAPKEPVRRVPPTRPPNWTMSNLLSSLGLSSRNNNNNNNNNNNTSVISHIPSYSRAAISAPSLPNALGSVPRVTMEDVDREIARQRAQEATRRRWEETRLAIANSSQSNDDADLGPEAWQDDATALRQAVEESLREQDAAATRRAAAVAATTVATSANAAFNALRSTRSRRQRSNSARVRQRTVVRSAVPRTRSSRRTTASSAPVLSNASPAPAAVHAPTSATYARAFEMLDAINWSSIVMPRSSALSSLTPATLAAVQNRASASDALPLLLPPPTSSPVRPSIAPSSSLASTQRRRLRIVS